MALDPRSPVLVGVGTDDHDAEAIELMVAAARAAATDTGAHDARGLLAAVDRVSVPKGTWGYSDPGRLVAERTGATGARSELAELGIPQQTLINRALTAIGSGRAEAVLVVGGEARAWGRRGTEASPRLETPQDDGSPDEHLVPTADIVSTEEIGAGLVAPVAQYAMIDNALRAAEGMTVERHRREIAELWSRFSAVAESNPAAAFGRRRSPEEIAEPGPANRPLAFPYNKWHASQWTVDQAAALLLCSVESARRWSVPPERWIFPVVGLEADHAVPLSRRRDVHRWPAMGALGRTARGHLGRDLADLEVTELYSCFPAAVRVQQRELGLPTASTPTVTGGMTFAGGPLNNFVYQATAAVVPRLRGRARAQALVSTVSGLLTKPGLAVWSSDPSPLLVADLAAESREVTSTVQVISEHHGEGRVVTCTVVHDPSGRRLIGLIEVADGRRVLASSDDPQLVEVAETEEMIGRRLTVAGRQLLP